MLASTSTAGVRDEDLMLVTSSSNLDVANVCSNPAAKRAKLKTQAVNTNEESTVNVGLMIDGGSTMIKLPRKNIIRVLFVQ